MYNEATEERGHSYENVVLTSASTSNAASASSSAAVSATQEESGSLGQQENESVPAAEAVDEEAEAKEKGVNYENVVLSSPNPGTRRQTDPIRRESAVRTSMSLGPSSILHTCLLAVQKSC